MQNLSKAGIAVRPYVPERGPLAVEGRLRRAIRSSHAGKRTAGCIALCLSLTALVGSGIAQSIPFDIRPSRVEAEVNPGAEKTVSFLIKTGAGAGPGRQTVTLESTDWTTQEDGSLKYAEPGTTRGSAVPWIKFSPSAFAAIPSAGQLVRITIAVPPGAAPGVYRSGIFVQERPPGPPCLPSKNPQCFCAFDTYFSFMSLFRVPLTACGKLPNVAC